MSHRLRFRSIQEMSRAIGADAPAASPSPSPAAGAPSTRAGEPRRIGELTAKVCIAAGEKSIARLKTRAVRLAAEISELRNSEVPNDRAVDLRVRYLAQVQAEIALMSEQVDALKAGARS